MRNKGRTPSGSPDIQSYLSVADVAARYGTGREQVHRWIRNKKLASIRVGKFVRIRPADLDEFERRHLRNAAERGER